MIPQPNPSSPRALRVLGSLALALFACTGTETDNPAQREPPPPYESPIDLGTPAPAPPGIPCPPPSDRGKPVLLPHWGRDAEVVVGAHPYRGLVILDAGEPEQPSVLGELALAGDPKQLVVEPGLQLSLAIEEVPVIHDSSVLEPRALGSTTRLVRYDASDPNAIARLDAVEIEGEFWRMDLRGSTLWVMSADVGEPVLSCNRNPFDCGDASRTGLILRAYRFEQGAWQAGQRVELPMNAQAWALPDGYASFQARSDSAQGGDLHYVRLGADGSLGEPAQLPVPGEPVPGAPIDVSDILARLFLLDYTTGTSELVTLLLDGSAALSHLREIQQQRFTGAQFGADAVYFGNENGSPALFADLRDASAPVLHAFPAPFSRVLLLSEGASGARVLALGQEGFGGALRIALFGQQAGVLSVLDEASLPGDFELAELHTLRLQDGRALFGVRGPDRAGHTVVVTWSDDALSVQPPLLTRFADEVLLLDDLLHAPDHFGLLVGVLGNDSSERFDWSRDVLQVARAGDWEAALVAKLGQAPQLELSRAGVLVSTLEVGPIADGLVADEQRVLLVSSLPREQCEQSGLDCSDYAPSVVIVTLDDEPAVTAVLPLPDQDLQESLPNSQRFMEWWSTPLALGEGRYVLMATLETSCTSEAACARLGIEPVPIDQAGVNVAPPGTPAPCPPGATTCPPPPPAPDPVTVYGAKTAQRFYLVDAAADTPRIASAVESVLELGDSQFGEPRVSGDTLLATRIEIAPGMASGPGMGSSLRRGRFMLDRFRVGQDGELHASSAVNVPGHPLALLADGMLALTVEPDADTEGAATLHLLELADDGARSVEQLALDARYGELQLALGKAFYLRRSGERCDGLTTLVPIALPDGASGELRTLTSLEIPGLRYRILDARDGYLLLGNDELQYVVVDVSGDTPVVTSFVSLPHPIYDAKLSGNAIVGAAGLFGRQHVSF